MKNLALIFLFVFSINLAKAQTTDSLKLKLSKEWIIKGYEQFGVTDEPKEDQKNDKVNFKADKSCTIVENGKTYSGTWVIDKTRTYVVCTLSNGSVKRSYKIISLKDKEAVIEYQSPDLIRTKYHMVAK